MPKDNDWGHILPVGTIVCDKEYPEDVGIIIERNIKGYYKVYSITGHWPTSNRSDWYNRAYVEDGCNVVIESSRCRKEKKESTRKRQLLPCVG